MKHKILGIIIAMLLVATVGLGSIYAQTADYQVSIELYPTADTTISLDGTTINVEGSGASVEGSVITISDAGTYSFNGTLTDGQIIVDTEDAELVTLVLNGVNLSSSTSAPINIKNAELAAILIADGTENYVSDATTYIYENAEDDEPNAAVFSDDDLTIYGTGSLDVTANYNDGIASKDSLTILSGDITVTSVDDGIRGKDYLIIDGANIVLNVQGDGLKSDNEDDATLGYINILSGDINITSGGDAVSAQSSLYVLDGTVTILSGGGSTANLSEDLSAKGLKSDLAIVIDGGTFVIDSADDAIHANDSIVINNGTFTLASGDDAIHADATIDINDGIIDIRASYEGIESAIITINDGNIHIVSSDDGINVASGSNVMLINGGYIVIDSEGDGLDANGSIVMTNGTVIVNGPTASMNSALDYDSSFQITGGTFVAVGSSNMMQAPDTSSTQYSLAVAFTEALSAGTPVSIQNSAGEIVLTFVPTKTYQSIVFSSSELVAGETYTIYQGGNVVGTATDGLYIDEIYSDGTAYTSLTLSSITTQEGGGDGAGGGRGGRGGRP
ncbi:MAG: carbohydrate-binding domain-containing protein [Phototrophicaceae bacterium]